MFTFNHFNFNVADLEQSLAFYREALGLEPVGRKDAADGSFILTYLGDGKTDFRLELTWLRDHAATPYELGENESHLCVRVAGDYEAVRAYHKELDASASKTTKWDSTSSTIRTTTGSKCCP